PVLAQDPSRSRPLCAAIRAAHSFTERRDREPEASARLGARDGGTVAVGGSRGHGGEHGDGRGTEDEGAVMGLRLAGRLPHTLAEIERRAILSAIRRHNGDKRAAASELGVSLKTVYNKLHTYGMMPE